MRALPGVVDALGRPEVGDRLRAAPQPGPLVDGRHEAGPPVPGTAGDLGLLDVLDDDVAGQVLVLGAEAVGHPAPQRRPAAADRAGVHLADAVDVVQPVGDARPDHRQVVGALGDVRQPVGDPHAALAVPRPLPPRLEQGRLHLPHRRDHPLDARRQGLAGEAVDLRLGVERVDLARPAFHEQEDDAPAAPVARVQAVGSGSKVRPFGRPAPGRAEQVGQAQRPEAGAAAEEHLAAGQGRDPVRDPASAIVWPFIGRPRGDAGVDRRSDQSTYRNSLALSRTWQKSTQARAIDRSVPVLGRRRRGAATRSASEPVGSAAPRKARAAAISIRSAGRRRRRAGRPGRSRLGGRRGAGRRAGDRRRRRPARGSSAPLIIRSDCVGVVVTFRSGGAGVAVGHVEGVEQRVLRVAERTGCRPTAGSSPGATLGPPICEVELAADGEHCVADRLGLEAADGHRPEQETFGIDRAAGVGDRAATTPGGRSPRSS